MKTECSNASSDAGRQAPVALLDQFNLAPQSFDGQHSDAFETPIANRSLEEPELVYLPLLKPGEACEEYNGFSLLSYKELV